MNQIAGVDGFNLMNNLRLIIIVAIFIGIIIVLLLNWILGARRRVKLKYMQAVNPHDDSSREERHAPGVVDDFFGMEESMEKEKSKGGESTAESEVEIEGPPVVNYEKIEADLKAIRDEVTTKIEGLILKVEAIEKAVLNKIDDVIDAKIQEASNKINDSLTEVLRTQKKSVTSVSGELVDSLCKEEIKEKEQTDTIAPSEEIEEKISEGDLGDSVDFDIQKLLEEEPVGISFTEESREVVEEMVESKKERDLGLPDEETIAHEGIDEKEIDTITPPGNVKEKALELAKGEDAEEKKQSTGKTVDFDIQKFLEELGTLPSEKG
jgi:hypothetical protein